MKNKIETTLKSMTLIVAVFIAMFGLVLLFSPAAQSILGGHRLADDSAGVACGTAFLYNDEEGAPEVTADTVRRLEELALEVCDGDEPARETKNHRHPNGELKHSVLLQGEVCVINWELTPEAHLAAFNDVCLNKNP